MEVRMWKRDRRKRGRARGGQDKMAFCHIMSFCPQIMAFCPQWWRHPWPTGTRSFSPALSIGWRKWSCSGFGKRWQQKWLKTSSKEFWNNNGPTREHLTQVCFHFFRVSANLAFLNSRKKKKMRGTNINSTWWTKLEKKNSDVNYNRRTNQRTKNHH